MHSASALASLSLVFAVLAHAVQSNPDAPLGAVICSSILSLGLIVSAFRSAT
jgi:hypothetical protein